MLKNKKLVYGFVTASVLLAAVVAWWQLGSPNNENFPDGTDWLCSDPKCATTFKMTMKELGAHNKKNFGQPVPCPKCNKQAVRSTKCNHCGKWHPQPHEGYKCPFCGKDNPPVITMVVPQPGGAAEVGATRPASRA